MPSPLKKPESMYDIIFKAVTKEGEDVQETARECKKLFKDKKDPADPNVLIQLEEVLRARQDEQAVAKHLELSKPGANPEALAELKKSVQKNRKHYDNYTQRFLPALLQEIIKSRKLKPEKIEEIVGIISDAIKQSGKEEYENFQRFLQELRKEIANSKELDLTKKTKIEKIIMELITLDAVSKSSDKDHSDSTMQNQNTTAGAVEVPSGANTSKLSSGNDSDSGIDSPRTSEESLESPINSRRSSVSSILSSAEENNDSQKGDTGLLESNLESPKENESQAQPEQAATEEPQVSSQCVTLGSREKESMDPNSQTTQMTGSQAKDSMQPEEKRDRKKATTTMQKPPVNEKKGEDTPLKQPNNRNLRGALVAGCALSTIGCIVAGVMTSGLIGAGLLAMAAVFAIAAVAELHSNFLSSKLTSINVSPLVDDKELTACSRL